MKQQGFFPAEWLNFAFSSCDFSLQYQAKQYQPIAKDDVGNFIAVSPTGQICFLVCASSQTVSSVFYVSASAELFAHQIQLYSHYTQTVCLPENPTDSELQAYETNFRNLILKTDLHAFDSETNFWAVIAEEMGYGI